MTPVTLDDKYTATDGKIFLSGTQALVRLPIEQARRDASAGHNTAGFISGYRGSPLGGYDSALWAAESQLQANRIHFEPGVNEDLAATAVWGTQQVPLSSGARYQGVFGIWYGKGPGVDRSADALKHANFAGTSPLGGVLALCGDDHAARSSTLAHQSDHVLIHCGMPVFNPSDIQDYIDLGLMGFSLSRFASLWVGFKCVTDIVDGSGTIMAGDKRVRVTLPADYEMPPGGLSIRHEVAALAQEARLFDQRLDAAKAFVRANALDRIVLGTGKRIRLGIVTTGKGVGDVGEALARLGIGKQEIAACGLAIYKVAMVWPLEPVGMRAFAERCDELLIIEEKRPVIEEQLAHILYNLPADQRPRLTGKTDERGAPLVPQTGELNADTLMRVLAARIDMLDGSQHYSGLANEWAAQSGSGTGASSVVRTPSFCAGCPHSASTRIPNGSIALAGIGCHGMASFMPDRPTLPGTQMGGEGAIWIGQSRFTDTPHVFQNLGDGTYFHSGLLAIRACVAAGVPITYKILLNGAVGMTGGQPIEGEDFSGEITAPHVAHQVASEGVKRIAIVSDDPGRFAGRQSLFPDEASFHPRDKLDDVQRELREWKGVSVLIYDQSCATERRRLRKRGKLPQAAERLMIASEVCEGCGDCGAQSGCIAIEPLETQLGRKRQINQGVCNQDYSCLKGFCPSFITVEGGTLRSQTELAGASDLAGDLPEPDLPLTDGVFSLVITGIGGAGVVTVGAILGMAAHLAGRSVSVLDMSGFAQRNGSVMSHLRIGETALPGSQRIPTTAADLVIGCDAIVSAGPNCLAMMKNDTAKVVLNRFVAPTAAFALDPNHIIDATALERRIASRVGERNLSSIDATAAATAILGNAIGANMILVGYAWQSGMIPIGREAIEQAIELNGAAVEMNLKAFALGRLAAVRADVIDSMMSRSSVQETPPRNLDELIESRAAHLVAYQGAALAARYRRLIDKVRTAEAALAVESNLLSQTVADVYARLLAYKDEYEVARLLGAQRIRGELNRTFAGKFKVRYNMAPPLLSRRDPRTGRLRKRSFGGWLAGPLALLARMKRLRGTPFDIFGYHPHRRMERKLIHEYEMLVQEILTALTPENHSQAVELASAYAEIRGFDVVKEAAARQARAEVARIRLNFQGTALPRASEVASARADSHAGATS